MIVAKFGGTAVTPQNLVHIKQIVGRHHGAVVVSAVGREFKTDAKVTDLLLDYFESGDASVWDAISSKYRRLAEVNGVNIDVESLLSDAQARSRRFGRAYCASLGEELSARIVAKFLGARYVEAEEVVRFDARGNLLWNKTFRNFRNAFGGQGVMGGFYGGVNGGLRQTFSRGGGDVTGAIAAAALGAMLYENWTDTDGVCIADPQKVHGVATISGMSYAEMHLLSLAGAEVLHPDAVAPCKQWAIPIKIGNFFHPQGASTLVTECPSHNKLLSVAEKFQNGFVTTVLHSYPLWHVMDKISRFLRLQTRRAQAWDSFFTTEPHVAAEFSPRLVRLVSSHSILVPLYKLLAEDQ